MSEVKNRRFFLGQEVATCKSGFPRIGTIVGVQFASLYKLMMQAKLGTDYKCSWDVQFPGWENGIVYMVWFNDGAKHMTKDELRAQKPDASEYEIDEFYDNMPAANPVMFVSDDLEETGDDGIYIPTTRNQDVPGQGDTEV